MKRTLSALLIGTLVLASITACGKESGSAEAKASTSATDKNTTTITPANSATLAPTTEPAASGDPATAESASGASIVEQFISDPIVDRQVFDRTNADVIASLNTYKSILKNESTFFDTYSKSDKYMNQFSSDRKSNLEPREFAIIDLDYDNLPEIVLAFKTPPTNYNNSGSVQYFVILHYENNKVSGYSLPYRGFAALKSDGTFSWANSAPNHGYGKIKFKTTFTEIEELIENYTYCDAHNDVYVVNQQPVTEAEFALEENHESHKPDVTWHEYSDENIEKYFS